MQALFLMPNYEEVIRKALIRLCEDSVFIIENKFDDAPSVALSVRIIRDAVPILRDLGAPSSTVSQFERLVSIYGNEEPSKTPIKRIKSNE